MFRCTALCGLSRLAGGEITKDIAGASSQPYCQGHWRTVTVRGTGHGTSETKLKWLQSFIVFALLGLAFFFTMHAKNRV